MPEVKRGESESHYVGRAVRQIMREGKTQRQAVGKAYGMFRSAKRKAKRKGR
jgi:hypothetical protein